MFSSKWLTKFVVKRRVEDYIAPNLRFERFLMIYMNRSFAHTSLITFPEPVNRYVNSLSSWLQCTQESPASGSTLHVHMLLAYNLVSVDLKFYLCQQYHHEQFKLQHRVCLVRSATASILSSFSANDN